MWQQSKEEYPNQASWWDAGKDFIKHMTQVYCREKAAKKRKHINSIRKRLRNMTNKNVPPPIKEALIQELQTYEEKEAQTARVHCKLMEKLEGEKCTKYFFALEQQWKMTTRMHRVLGEDGKIKTLPNEILKEVQN